MRSRRSPRVTVLHLVSHAAGHGDQRSIGGPERRALAGLARWDYSRLHVIVAYARHGRLWHEFEAAATRHQPHVTLIPFPPLRRRDWTSLWPLVRIITRYGVEVVHTEGAHGTDWWAATAARLTGCASVVTRPIALCDYDLPPRTFARFRLTDRWALSRSHMVFVSSHVRERSIACGEAPPDRSTVILNGVDLTQFRPPQPLDETTARASLARRPPRIGMVGQLLPVKDWDTFLETAGRVFADVPDAEAVIVGDGPERDRLRRAIAERGWTDRVHMTGFCADVSRVVSDFDVFLLTSRREGLPVAIVEAMALGRPVVATDVGGVREIVTPGVTGFLTDAGDAAALARHTVDLLRDPARRARFGAAARQDAVSRLSLEAMVSAYQELFIDAHWRTRAGISAADRRDAGVRDGNRGRAVGARSRHAVHD